MKVHDYYRENDGASYLRVLVIWRDGTFAFVGPSVSGNPTTLEHGEADLAYLETCTPIDRADVPDRWLAALGS